MRINIDNRQTDCLYVDKANLHTADTTEIIKFIVAFKLRLKFAKF